MDAAQAACALSGRKVKKLRVRIVKVVVVGCMLCQARQQEISYLLKQWLKHVPSPFGEHGRRVRAQNQHGLRGA